MTVCIAAVSAMLFAAPAVAQTASQQEYDGTGVIGQLGGENEQGGPTGGVGGGDNAQNVAATTVTAGEDEGGSLPFTGLDIAIVALMGALLVGTGLVLRRSARPSQG